MVMTKVKRVLAMALMVELALAGIGLGVNLSTTQVAVAQTETPKGTPMKGENPTSPVATRKDDKPPHIVEKPDMKGRVVSGLPSGATKDGSVVVKRFFAKMPTYPDIRFREFFDPRYLMKHGLTDRDISFEIAHHQGIDSLHVADDNQTVLVFWRSKEEKEKLSSSGAWSTKATSTSLRRKLPTRKPASLSLGFCGGK